jgi:hypothetical protein
MKKEDIAYCGLDCELCNSRFAEIREKIQSLEESFEKVKMQEIAEAIPNMSENYKGFKELAAFFSFKCPGCRNKGGNLMCEIRKCAIEKGFFTCAECDELCSKFKPLFEIHTDNEIHNNIEGIKENGIDKFVEMNS